MAEANNETTIIAADTRIKGEMVFERTARIQGEFEGKIFAKGELQIDGTATCRTEVETDNIVIDGTVEGNVKATQRLKLNAQARVKGDIVADRLSAEEGASIEGQVMIGPQATKATPSSDATSVPPVSSQEKQDKPQQRPQPVVVQRK